MSNVLMEKLSDFLYNKPLWVWWLAYLVLTGGLFGLFNLAVYLLGINPLIGVLVLIAIAMVWGTLMYSHHGQKRKKTPKKTTNSSEE
ncbi:MAG: hypothetical protein PF447_14015 [Spirochaetaceae bacterium]|jgi:hypothetical protein|nr:hypothetical protein [Spirochaetaceae bacterium]